MIKNITKRNYILIYAFMLIIFFEPQIFKENSFVGVKYFDYIYKIAKIICFVFASSVYIKENKYKISKLLISIIVLQSVMLLSTLIYNGDLIRFVGPAITTVTMCMIAELLVKKKIIFPVLKIVNNYFAVCFIINLISIILIDFTNFNKIVSVYFLGIDNRFIFTLLPWILFEGLVSLKECNKISKRWIIIFIASELILVYKFSVAAMIALFIYIFAIIEFKKEFKHKESIFFGYIITNISIIMFKIQRFFIHAIKFVKKDITFSGRTYIWDGIIKEFINYPIIGRGMQSIEYDKNFFFNSSAPHYIECCKVIHAHNSLMTLLYRGGILSVLIYLGILYKTVKELCINYSNKYAKLFYITLIIILITSIFDTMDFAGLYFIITLIVNIKLIDKT